MKISNRVFLRCAIGSTLALLMSACNPEEDVVNPADLNEWTYFRNSDGLPSNAIASLYEDSAGQIWIGTDRGLSVYDGSRFTNYSTADGLVSNSVYAVVEDKDGAIWAGSAGGLNIYVDEQWFYFADFYGVEINALLEISDNDILIGTGGYGVYRYDHDSNALTVFDVSSSCTTCNGILALFEDSEQNIWVGSFEGARSIKGNVTATFNTATGLSGNIITDFAEDSFGNIWVGSFDGTTIARISGSSVEKINFSTGSEQSLSLSLERDDFGRIWIGTGVFGLYNYDGAVINRVYEGPPGNTIRTMLTDTRGNLWVGSTTGLARYVVGINQ